MMVSNEILVWIQNEICLYELKAKKFRFDEIKRPYYIGAIHAYKNVVEEIIKRENVGGR